MKVDNPDEAVDEFLGISALEQDKSEWYDPLRTVAMVNINWDTGALKG